MNETTPSSAEGALPMGPQIGSTVQLQVAQRLESQFLYAENILAVPLQNETIEVVLLRNEVAIAGQTATVNAVEPTLVLNPSGAYTMGLSPVDLGHIRFPRDGALSAAINLLRAVRGSGVSVEDIKGKLDAAQILDPDQNHSLGVPRAG